MSTIQDLSVVSVKSDNVEALVSVNKLNLVDGSVHLIAGASGSGKSLFFRAILGLVRDRQIESRCRIDGPLQRWISDGLVFFVPPDPATVLPEELTIGQYCRMIRCIEMNQVPGAMKGMNLEWETVRKRYPRELSGGERQRVLLSILASSHARVIVLDEPTVGLDLQNVDRLGKIISGLRSKNSGSHRTTILFATHSPDLVRALKPSRYVLFENGATVLHGSKSAFIATGNPIATALTERVRPKGDQRRKSRKTSTESHREIRVSLREQRVGRSFINSGIVVVRDCEFELRRGTIHFVHGQSGSGKTTLLKAISRCISHTDGIVSFFGTDLVELQPKGELRDTRFFHKHYRPRIYFMTQHAEHALVQRLCVRSGLELTVSSQTGNRPKQIDLVDAAKRVGISPQLLDRYPWQLSTGEKRRMDLVRLLLVDPDLLLLDEPFGNLDLPLANEIVSILARRIEKNGMCCVMVTHRNDIVSEISKRIPWTLSEVRKTI